MNDSIRRGGCQCGAIRFVATGPAGDVAYCHCRTCQRTTGAPLTAWGDWEVQRFRFTSKEQPRVFASSATGERWFCGQCGSSIAFFDRQRPNIVEINLLALDDPATVQPTRHSWTSRRIAWFEIGDKLPRFDEEPPQ